MNFLKTFLRPLVLFSAHKLQSKRKQKQASVFLVGYQILIDGETAVGDDDRTGDVTRFVGGEIQNCRRLFF